MTKEKTCAELVQEKWQSTRVDLAAMLLGENWDIYKEDQGYGLSDDAYDGFQAFSEYGLSWTYNEPEDGSNGFYCYLMSWGGPSDELRFYADIRGQCHVIEYWYMDWFDGAKHVVTDDEAAKAVASYFAECEAFESAYNEAQS